MRSVGVKGRAASVPPWLAVLPIGGLFVAAAARQSTVPAMLLTAGFGAVCVLLAGRDLRERIVPNRVVYAALLAVFLLSPLRPDGFLGTVEGALAAGAPLAVVCLATRGGIGGGDVKMATLVGAFAGYPAAVTAVAVAAAAGAVAAVLLRALAAPLSATIPYAPFLALGVATVLAAH